jgi:hypothetical protein
MFIDDGFTGRTVLLIKTRGNNHQNDTDRIGKAIQAALLAVGETRVNQSTRIFFCDCMNEWEQFTAHGNLAGTVSVDHIPLGQCPDASAPISLILHDRNGVNGGQMWGQWEPSVSDPVEKIVGTPQRLLDIAIGLLNSWAPSPGDKQAAASILAKVLDATDAARERMLHKEDPNEGIQP